MPSIAQCGNKAH